MKRLTSILIITFVTAVLMLVVVPLTAYVMLSTPWAQARLRAAACSAAESVLGTDVEVGALEFIPFNRIRISDVRVCDDHGDTALTIGALEARLEPADLLFRRKLVADYIALKQLDATVARADEGSPTNIDGIIAHVASLKKEDSGKKLDIDIRLNTISIEDSRLAYRVLSAPTEEGVFTPKNVCLDNLNVVIEVPLLSSDAYIATLKNLSFDERSGFTVSNSSFRLYASEDSIAIDGISIELPSTKLQFGDIRAKIDGYGDLGRLGTRLPLDVQLLPGSHVYAPDLKAFVPALAQFPAGIDVSFKAQGVLSDLGISELAISDRSGISHIEGGMRVHGLPVADSLRVEDCTITAALNPSTSDLAKSLLVKYMADGPLRRLIMAGAKANIELSGELANFQAKATVASPLGHASARGRFGLAKRSVRFNASGTCSNVDLRRLLGANEMGSLSATFSGSGSVGRRVDADATAKISRFEYRGYEYQDISISVHADPEQQRAQIDISDPNADMAINADMAMLCKGEKSVAADISISNICPQALMLMSGYEGYSFTADAKVRYSGESLRRFKASAQLSDIAFADGEGHGLRMGHIEADADNMGPGKPCISIASDIINGSLTGDYDLLDIWPDISDILCQTMPALRPALASVPESDPSTTNEFSFDFDISQAADYTNFFKLPISLTDPISISGELSQSRKQIKLVADIPWMLQGGNAIEGTLLTASVDALADTVGIYATTHTPTKKGPMTVVATVEGGNDLLLTTVDWEIEREQPISGRFDFATTLLMAEPEGKLGARVAFNPGVINFGSDVWQIEPSVITIAGQSIVVDDFAMQSSDQRVEVNGTVSHNPDDAVVVKLDNFQLISIFETLEIDNALICGRATCEIEASGLMSPTPNIQSRYFMVKDMGYNYCVLGDGNLQVAFDNENQSFTFLADITDEAGRVQKINGMIQPATEGIEFYFDVNHAKVGFMQPFMEAFCSSIEGYASGRAHLYGTFSFIDLEGDLLAEDLRMKIDFTNTVYSVTDSVHMRPGEIIVREATLHDEDGNTAVLNGAVWHKFMKEPSFDFAITEAHNFLCYDVPAGRSPRWYGRIYGNGIATIKGKPGLVSIGAAMTTAPRTDFTYVLTDQEEAREYSFINFRDVTPQPEQIDSILDITVPSMAEMIVAGLVEAEEEDEPTNYAMEFNIDITPDADITIIMDPAGGDNISCRGKGHMTLQYESQSDVAKMFGQYELERGIYWFTWQSLIYRDFTIVDGSKITFSGSPYDAQLDIKAYYQVNANLSDLDESFLNDKELNRTNVPVQAMMHVTGDMRQPDISFGLHFPTLNDDIERKVMSIVSTDDMMNMQIIYLLALNRFYTPEYMNATKGNELFSVASSTISSQISSALGKLSNNWSISPNLRSDRGDFSDLEVDLTLQSHLLNNRLLLNGNLGYRDRSLNTNQFIGDFDIEYLLNRAGTLRLKGYSRYNDQNYYLRTAKTTQGIGFVYKRDFDMLFRFLSPRKKTEIVEEEPETEIEIVPESEPEP